MVRAIMMVEMAGRPEKYLSEKLANHVEVLRKVKTTNVNDIKISEPKEIKTDKNKSKEPLFTAFAEIDFETQTLAQLTQIMFDFMPSSIEVIEPANLDLTSTDATELLNNISGRMHRYDELARIALAKLKKAEAGLKSNGKSAAKKL